MDEYYGNNDWRDYLALQHHGILGQKWGHRNGPPYPLGGSDHSASEKKAGWQKSLSGGSGGTVKRRKIKESTPAREEIKKLNKDMVLYGPTGTVIKRRLDTKKTGNDTRVSTTIRNYQKEQAKKLGDKEAIKELNAIEKGVKERDAKKAAKKEERKQAVKNAYVSGLQSIAESTERERANKKDFANRDVAIRSENQKRISDWSDKHSKKADEASGKLSKAYHKSASLVGKVAEASNRQAARERFSEDENNYLKILSLKTAIKRENSKIGPGNSLSKAYHMANVAQYREQIKDLESNISDENLEKLRKIYS